MASSSVDAIGRRKHKLSKRQNSNKGSQDLISNLPDHIIGCILSFLPTKDAVSTSVLSQRWIYLWTFITKLDFDDIGYCSSNEIRKTCFVDFVDRVLLRLNSAHIRSFSLKMSEKYDSSYINKWISIVINLRVRKLRVYLQNDLSVSSDPLLKCQFLEELVLSQCAITLSTFVCLSSLAVLDLYCIIISCGSSSDSKTLTLNFPVLRKFVTFGCIWSGVKSVTLQVPLLEVVSISYHPFYRTSHAEIKFYASHIATFCYYGHMSDTILFDAHSVASADITLYNKNKKSPQEIGIFVCKLLSINPECLKLSVHGCISQFVKHSFADIRPFKMLRHLELSFVGCNNLLGILLKSPCLETLILEEYYEGMLMSLANVPLCLVSTLKVLKFKIFGRSKRGLSVAKFFIENGQVLERISIRCDTRFQKEILSFRKSSSSAIIEFLS